MKLAVLVLVASNAFFSAKVIGNTCGPNEFKTNILKSSGEWVATRKNDEFKPILGVTIFNSGVWLSTFGADYFPVKLNVVENKLLIENIVFRREPVGSKVLDKEAYLVKKYRDPSYEFTFKKIDESCSLGDTLVTEILNTKSNTSETIIFQKNKGISGLQFEREARIGLQTLRLTILDINISVPRFGLV